MGFTDNRLRTFVALIALFAALPALMIFPSQLVGEAVHFQYRHLARAGLLALLIAVVVWQVYKHRDALIRAELGAAYLMLVSAFVLDQLALVPETLIGSQSWMYFEPLRTPWRVIDAGLAIGIWFLAVKLMFRSDARRAVFQNHQETVGLCWPFAIYALAVPVIDAARWLILSRDYARNGYVNPWLFAALILGLLYLFRRRLAASGRSAFWIVLALILLARYLVSGLGLASDSILTEKQWSAFYRWSSDHYSLGSAARMLVLRIFALTGACLMVGLIFRSDLYDILRRRRGAPPTVT